MRRLSMLLIVGALTAGAWLGQPRSAAAGEVSVSLGVGFVVGGATFHVVYGSGPHVPYYYRMATPLYDPGYGCTTHCHARGGHYFHAPFCPRVRHHFDVHRYDGYWRHAYRHGRHYRGHRDYGHTHWQPGRHDRHRRPHYGGHDRSRHRRGHEYYGRSRGHLDRRFDDGVRRRPIDRVQAERDRRGERHRKQVSGRIGSAHRTRPRD